MKTFFDTYVLRWMRVSPKPLKTHPRISQTRRINPLQKKMKKKKKRSKRLSYPSLLKQHT